MGLSEQLVEREEQVWFSLKMQGRLLFRHVVSSQPVGVLSKLNWKHAILAYSPCNGLVFPSVCVIDTDCTEAMKLVLADGINRSCFTGIVQESSV